METQRYIVTLRARKVGAIGTFGVHRYGVPAAISKDDAETQARALAYADGLEHVLVERVNARSDRKA
jgi:hypothetical protein